MQLIQNGQNYSLGNFGSLPNKLPLGTYNLLFNKKSNEFYLHLIDDTKLPNKVYGDIIPFTNRICKKYNFVTKNLGVLLVGTKGSGKTLMAKAIANKLNLPVIIIPEGYDSSEFISFLTDSALGDCIILIDEFEKLYNDQNADSNKILSLLDGPYNTHHIFVFTANEFHKINYMMKNRPSRIHFLKEFNGLDKDTITDIGNDVLNNKDFIPELIDISQKMAECTFDVVLSICEDCNLYNESPKQVIKHMNVLLETMYYDVFEKTKGELKHLSFVSLNEDGKWSGLWIKTKILENGDYEEFFFDPNEYTPISKDNNEIVFEIPTHGITLILKRRANKLIKYVY